MVEEIDGPIGAVRPVAVDVQRPYSCFGSKGSIGQLDPGTYTVHVWYDGQPEKAELSTGTFTVKSSPSPRARCH
ncbi:MAG: hypothetical protein E6I45_01950 [Chloroflexi bacterium]|nr:MAG: hypothetical protein E6I45_01950 [Chloroflexota bacterium]